MVDTRARLMLLSNDGRKAGGLKGHDYAKASSCEARLVISGQRSDVREELRV